MGCHNPGYPFGVLEPMKEPINVTIRQFTQEDLDAVVSINRKALPENYPSDFFLYCFNLSSITALFKIPTSGGSWYP